jgi:hypothetical protein
LGLEIEGGPLLFDHPRDIGFGERVVYFVGDAKYALPI